MTERLVADRLLQAVNTVDVLVLLVVLGIVVSNHVYRKLPYFFALLSVSFLHQLICVPLIFYRAWFGVSKPTAYHVIVSTEWTAQLVEVLLTILCVFSAFEQLMRPLEGLHRLGKIVFRWIAASSSVLALVVAFAPHTAGKNFVATVISQLVQGSSVLTLCLLLFVCFATSPLGLTYRSHLFGLILGLGVGATGCLLQSVWLSAPVAANFYSPLFLISGFTSLLAMIIWGAYLSRPEPARRLTLLPTTSPFFTWNSVAEALGDAPGEVAVGGVPPEMFAPAELLAFQAPAHVVEMPQAAQR